MLKLCSPLYILVALASAAVFFSLLAFRWQRHPDRARQNEFDQSTWFLVALLVVAVLSMGVFMGYAFLRIGGC